MKAGGSHYLCGMGCRVLLTDSGEGIRQIENVTAIPEVRLICFSVSDYLKLHSAIIKLNFSADSTSWLLFFFFSLPIQITLR